MSLPKLSCGVPLLLAALVPVLASATGLKVITAAQPMYSGEGQYQVGHTTYTFSGNWVGPGHFIRLTCLENVIVDTDHGSGRNMNAAAAAGVRLELVTDLHEYPVPDTFVVRVDLGGALQRLDDQTQGRGAERLEALVQVITDCVLDNARHGQPPKYVSIRFVGAPEGESWSGVWEPRAADLKKRY